jgi:O-antigen ligase/Tfp pilus assembly protein PilF
MQNSETHKLPSSWFDLLFLAGIAFIGLCQIRDPLFLFGILAAIFLLWKGRRIPFSFSKIDKLLLLIYLYQIANLFFSTNPISGFFAIKTLTFSIIFYFLLRICLNSASKIKKFLSVVSFLIAVLCTVALITFLLFRSTCAHVEFNNLYDFRYLYRPIGYLSNVWGSLLIGFTGIVLLSLHGGNSKKTKFFFLLLLLALLSGNMVVSFSRGVYMALAVLLLLYLLFLIFSNINRTRKMGILVALIFPLGIAGWIQKQEVVKTLQFNQSQSQQRSIAGRMDAMSFSYELFKKSPATGFGAGTYSQVINEYKYEDDDNSFTDFAPNGYMQLLVEQGILGLVLWGMFFVAVFTMLFKKRKDSPTAIITGIILLAVLIREATFPVLLESAGFQLLIFTILAIFQNTLSYKKSEIKQKYSRYFPAAIGSIAFLICAYSVYYMADSQNNRKALSAMEAGHWKAAEESICKTTERTPYLINRSLIFSELYEKTGDTSYLNRAENCLQKARLKNPYDVMIRYYLASVWQKEGNQKAALSILTKIVEKFPNKSLYQLSIFDLLYKSGQQEKAFPHLLQAVKLSPDLLDSSYLKDILSKDSITNESLKNKLLQGISLEKFTDDPIFLAKSGKLFLSFGLEKEAKEYLESAIRLLPNLIYPHYYLSKIEMSQNNPVKSQIYLKQFVILYSASLSKDGIDKITHSGEIEKRIAGKKAFTDHSYPAKFQTWYHSLTVLKQFIP